MAHQKHDDTQHKRNRGVDMGSAIALGLSLGTAFGIILDNISYGMIVGLNLGILAALISERRQNKQGATVAIGINLISLLFIVLLWIFAR